MECHLKWSVTQKCNVTQNEMLLKLECHSKWDVT